MYDKAARVLDQLSPDIGDSCAAIDENTHVETRCPRRGQGRGLHDVLLLAELFQEFFSNKSKHRGIRGPKVTAKVTGRRRRRHPRSCASPPDARRLMLTLTIDTAASGRARPAPPARAPLPWRLARTATRAHRRTRPTRRPRPLPRAAPVRRRRPRTRTSGKGMPSCAS